MNNLIYKIILITLPIFFVTRTFSQTQTDTTKQLKKMIIKMKDGDKFIGHILKIDDDMIFLRTENADINFSFSNVKKIKGYGNDAISPHYSRYFSDFFGRFFKKKEFHYDTTLKVIIKMKDGDKIIGHILKKDNDTIFLRTKNTDINFLSSNVKKIKGYGNDVTNPHYSRYFFSFSGRPLKKKEFHYHTTLLVMQSLNYGITKNFSIGGGFLFDTLVDVVAPPNTLWFVTPKVGFTISKNIHVGGGLLMRGDMGSSAIKISGYGVVTLGSSQTNLSLVLGHDFLAKSNTVLESFMDLEEGEMGFLGISATCKVSEKVALLLETYRFSNAGARKLSIANKSFSYISYGIRILFRKHTFDFGFATIPFNTGNFIIPNISYGLSFGTGSKRNKLH